MLNLISTSDIIRVTASSTNAISVSVEYVDHTASAYTPGRQLTALASVALTTICSAPAASTTRSVKCINFTAKGGANTIVLEQFDGTTAAQLIGGSSYTLNQGDTLQYSDMSGWSLFAAGGPGAGRLLAIQYKNPGDTTITHTTGATTAVVEGVGGGGAGGGTSAASGSLGANGGAGTWGRKRVTLASLSSTCAVGAAGAGASAAVGGNGGDTTFTHNGVTMTLPGGKGGTQAAGGVTLLKVAGGAKAAAATNADISVQGNAGGDALRSTAATTPMNHISDAGSGPLGSGGVAQYVIVSGTVISGISGNGFGAGSCGVLNGASVAAAAAPNGQPGLLIVYDYA